MKLRSRLLFLIITALCISALCCFLVATHAFKQILEESTSAELSAQCRYLASELEAKADLPKSQIRSYLDRYSSLMGVRITLVDEQGQVLYDSQAALPSMDNHIWRQEIRTALEVGEGESTRKSDTLDTTMLYHAFRMGYDQQFVLRLGSPLGYITIWQSQFIWLLLPMMLLLLLCVVMISLLLIRRITRPIEALASAATSYAAGDLSPRTLIEEPQELKQLSATMNMMATELAQRLEQLEQDTQLYSSILLSMSEGVLLVDRKQTILLANQAATSLLSNSTDTLVGKGTLHIFGDETLSDAIDKTAAGEGPKQVTLIRHGHLHGQVAQLMGAGKEKIFQVSTAKINDEGEVVVTFTDITEIKRLEQVRKDFVANVSHELKTPLTAISGFSEILEEGNVLEENRKKFSHIINRNARQMKSIIDDLLLLASLENENASPSLAPSTIDSLLTETIEDTLYKAQEKQIAVEVRIINPKNRTILVNQGLMVQALVNLVVNAITYSPPQSQVILSAQVSEDIVSFTVKDFGCGIPKQDLDRIFERFYRVDKARSRSQGGTGLGLSIVKHVAMLHGGNVTVESTEHEGSQFTITIPIENSAMSKYQLKSSQLYEDFH